MKTKSITFAKTSRFANYSPLIQLKKCWPHFDHNRLSCVLQARKKSQINRYNHKRNSAQALSCRLLSSIIFVQFQIHGFSSEGSIANLLFEDWPHFQVICQKSKTSEILQSCRPVLSSKKILIHVLYSKGADIILSFELWLHFWVSWSEIEKRKPGIGNRKRVVP